MKGDRESTTELKQIHKIREVRNNLRDLYELAPSVHILSASTMLGRYKDMLEQVTSEPTLKSAEGLVVSILKKTAIPSWKWGEVAKEILSTITTTPETASEGKEVLDLDGDNFSTCGGCKTWPICVDEQHYCHICGVKLIIPTQDNEGEG